MHVLGDLSVETFLKDYWQKKPVLIRQALPNFTPPIEPDDLAGLSLEEDVESRIILENGDTPWQLIHGPFSEETFGNLPEEKWTLLVQGVDQWVPEMSELLSYFQFIPKWRLDDIMVSFAPKGGSVGPHFDQYDVFLLQAQGRRHWQIGPKYDASSPRIKDTPLHLLENMEMTEEWTLEPGDMLYIPPQYAHNGVAVDDCMTFSVGFRAPSEAEILSGITQHAMDQLTEADRYHDEDLKANAQPALIDQTAFDRLQQIIAKHANNTELMQEWFAECMTQSKYPELAEPLEDPLDWEEVAPLLQDDTVISQNETSRWAYYENNKQWIFYANGQRIFTASAGELGDIAKTLWDQRQTTLNDIKAILDHSEGQELLLTLLNNNLVYIDEE